LAQEHLFLNGAMESESDSAEWVCKFQQPLRYSPYGTCRESSALCIAGVFGIRLRLQLMNGKVHLGLTAPTNVKLKFRITVSWAELSRDEGMNPAGELHRPLREQGRTEGEHAFNGGWISFPTASSACMNCCEALVAIVIQDVEWKDPVDKLANELEFSRKEQKDLKRLVSALQEKVSVAVQGKDALSRECSKLRAEQRRMEDEAVRKHAETQAALESERVSKNVEVRRALELKRDVALLSGDLPSIRQLDSAALDQLLATVNTTVERVRHRVETLREEDRVCKVCFENARDTVLNACGHFILCSRCAERVTECPACRAQVAGVTKVYL